MCRLGYCEKMPDVHSTEGGVDGNASVGTDKKGAWASGLLSRGSHWKRIMRRLPRRCRNAGVRENVHHQCRADERQEEIVHKNWGGFCDSAYGSSNPSPSYGYKLVDQMEQPQNDAEHIADFVDSYSSFVRDSSMDESSGPNACTPADLLNLVSSINVCISKFY